MAETSSVVHVINEDTAPEHLPVIRKQAAAASIASNFRPLIFQLKSTSFSDGKGVFFLLSDQAATCAGRGGIWHLCVFTAKFPTLVSARLPGGGVLVCTRHDGFLPSGSLLSPSSGCVLTASCAALGKVPGGPTLGTLLSSSTGPCYSKWPATPSP